MHAVDAEDVRDLVRVGDDGGRAERKDQPCELVDHQLHRLEVHVRVDEARDDVASRRVERLVALVATDARDDAVDDRDVGVEPLAGEDREDATTPDDEVGRLVSAGDGDRRCSPSIEGSVMRGALSYSRRVSRQAGQEEQMRRKFVLGGLVLALAVTALALAGGGAARSEQEPFKVAWIYPGPHNDGGWSQAHDKGRLDVEKALGSKVADDLQGEHLLERAGAADRREPRSRRQQDDLRLLVRVSSSSVSTAAVQEVPGRPLRAGDRVRRSRRTSREYFGAGEDTIYLSGMAAGAATKKGVIGYIVPFAIPEVIRHANAFALGAQATHPGAKVKLVWTNVVVSTRQGEEGREEPHRRGRRRARAERRQPGRRRSTPSRRASRGSATTPTRGSSRRRSG